MLITWQARAIVLELHQTLGGKLHWRLDWTSDQHRQNAADSNATLPNPEFIVMRVHSKPVEEKPTPTYCCATLYRSKLKLHVNEFLIRTW